MSERETREDGKVTFGFLVAVEVKVDNIAPPERMREVIQEDIERNSDIQDSGGTRRRKIWHHIRSHMSFRGEREDDTADSDADPPPPRMPTL